MKKPIIVLCGGCYQIKKYQLITLKTHVIIIMAVVFID